MKAVRSQALPHILLAAVILLTLAGYALTLRPGQDWGGDFAMYIHHAANIVEGKPYADTGYIYNPHYPSLGPRTYPPVYPFLLAPVYKVFGLDYAAFKIENILFFVAALAVLFVTFRKELPDHARLAAIVLVAANPYFWSQREDVRPEFLFLLLTLLALYAIDRVYRAQPGRPPALRHAFLIGGLCYLAYGTRSLGVLLIPALIIHDIALFHRPSRFSVVATTVFGALAGLQSLFAFSDGSYAEQLATIGDLPALLAGNAVDLAHAFCLYFADGRETALCFVLGFIVGMLAIVGSVIRARRKLSVYEAFFALYLAAILVWPAPSFRRFLIILFPLALLYATAGLLALFRRMRAATTAVSSLLLLTILLAYASVYPNAKRGPIAGVESPQSTALFAFIREETPQDAVLIFRKPRPLSLYTGRAASVYHQAADDQELWDYLREIGADYVIVDKEFGDDRRYLDPFVQRYDPCFDQIYESGGMAVYEICSPEASTQATPWSLLARIAQRLLHNRPLPTKPA